MMNFEKYTNSSKKIINSAQNLALSKKKPKNRTHSHIK